MTDIKIHIKFQLAALWTSVMFLYIYADYFQLYQPGALQAMLAGKMAPFGMVTQTVLAGISTMMIVPSLMVFLSIALKPAVNRWLNIVFGIVYTLIILATLPGSWAFYDIYGIIEIVLTLLIVVLAWRWPKADS